MAIVASVGACVCTVKCYSYSSPDGAVFCVNRTASSAGIANSAPQKKAQRTGGQTDSQQNMRYASLIQRTPLERKRLLFRLESFLPSLQVTVAHKYIKNYYHGGT